MRKYNEIINREAFFGGHAEKIHDWRTNAAFCSRYKDAKRRVNKSNMYCSTKKELAKLLDISVRDLYYWQNTWLGVVEKQTVRDKATQAIVKVYDAKPIIEKWGFYLKLQNGD